MLIDADHSAELDSGPRDLVAIGIQSGADGRIYRVHRRRLAGHEHCAQRELRRRQPLQLHPRRLTSNLYQYMKCLLYTVVRVVVYHSDCLQVNYWALYRT